MKIIECLEVKKKKTGYCVIKFILMVIVACDKQQFSDDWLFRRVGGREDDSAA